MRFRLHNIVFKDEELYINGNMSLTDSGSIRLSHIEGITTGTYFGAMSVGKWARYTVIDNISLCISLCGTFKITIYHIYPSERPGGRYRKDVVNEVMVRTIGRVEKKYDIPVFDEGLVYFTITDVRKESFIYDAYYCTEVNAVNNVKLALNICTYKRFEYLKRNIELIKNELFDTSPAMERDVARTNAAIPETDDATASVTDKTYEDTDDDGIEYLDDIDVAGSGYPDDLSGRLEVYITDNASEIDKNEFGDKRIKVFHNHNLGGSGGFTNGLLQILKSANGITHVIFMDDDADICSESIRRTYAMLALLRPEYREYFIGGALLRSECGYIQHENGAKWNGGKNIFAGRGLDMRQPENLVANELDQDVDYAAWWYCCIPASVIGRDNLPIPVFLHTDDTEYSLRNAEGIITMNGIAIWHPATLRKRASVYCYYDLRNLLIVNSRYRISYRRSKAFKKVFTDLLTALSRHRYKDMDLIYRAVDDFLKGPDFLLNTDPSALHKEIVEAGYRFEDVSEWLEDKNTLLCTDEEITGASSKGFKAMFKEASSFGKKMGVIGRILSLDGWFCHPHRYPEAHYMNAHPAELYRAGRLILFDDRDNMGLVLDKKFSKLFTLIGYAVRLRIKMFFGYGKARREYNRRWKELTSDSYWNGVLKEP